MGSRSTAFFVERGVSGSKPIGERPEGARLLAKLKACRALSHGNYHPDYKPGVTDLSARVIMAEIGNDMSRFPTDGRLISWAGLCPKSEKR
jgi:transposase